MSVGTDLLELQETDLALMRSQAMLDKMPEVAALARKRSSYKKLKADAAKLMGMRKDAEMALADLEAERHHAEASVSAVHQSAGSTADYQEVKRLEMELSSLAKRLDKIAFSKKDAEKRLAELVEKEGALARYIERFEAAVIEDTRAVREKAGDALRGIEELKSSREALRAHIPTDVLDAYDAAAKEFNGLAVEHLTGNKPSVCRVALQTSSMGDLKGEGELARCPYCHRILVLDRAEEE